MSDMSRIVRRRRQERIETHADLVERGLSEAQIEARLRVTTPPKHAQDTENPDPSANAPTHAPGPERAQAIQPHMRTPVGPPPGVVNRGPRHE